VVLHAGRRWSDHIGSTAISTVAIRGTMFCCHFLHRSREARRSAATTSSPARFPKPGSKPPCLRCLYSHASPKTEASKIEE
jgi:hypothetical protein